MVCLVTNGYYSDGYSCILIYLPTTTKSTYPEYANKTVSKTTCNIGCIDKTYCSSIDIGITLNP